MMKLHYLRSILTIDETLIELTALDLSGPESNGNEKVPTHQSSRIRASPLDALKYHIQYTHTHTHTHTHTRTRTREK